MADSALDRSAAMETDFPSAETAEACISFSDFSCCAFSLPSADSSVFLSALRLPATSAPASLLANDLDTLKSPSRFAASNSRSYQDFCRRKARGAAPSSRVRLATAGVSAFLKNPRRKSLRSESQDSKNGSSKEDLKKSSRRRRDIFLFIAKKLQNYQQIYGRKMQKKNCF